MINMIFDTQLAPDIYHMLWRLHGFVEMAIALLVELDQKVNNDRENKKWKLQEEQIRLMLAIYIKEPQTGTRHKRKEGK